jgi:hypothetical protein
VRERATGSRAQPALGGGASRSEGVGTVGLSGTGPSAGRIVGCVAGSARGSAGPTLPYEGERTFIARVVGSSVIRPPHSARHGRDEP